MSSAGSTEVRRIRTSVGPVSLRPTTLPYRSAEPWPSAGYVSRKRTLVSGGRAVPSRTSRSRGPAPRRQSPGVRSCAAASSRARATPSRSAAAAASGTSTSWICPIIVPGSASATKPPAARATSAALEAAAITEGSSTTMGITCSRPFTRKLSATPKGSAKVPSAFSTIVSATSSGSAWSAPSVSRSAGERSSAPASFRRRSSTGRRWKAGIREVLMRCLPGASGSSGAMLGSSAGGPRAPPAPGPGGARSGARAAGTRRARRRGRPPGSRATCAR